MLSVAVITGLALLVAIWLETNPAPRRRPLVFSLLFFTACLAALVVTPPFQTPDAGSHYFRAWQISEGSLLGEKRVDDSGAVLPRALAEDFHRFDDLLFRFDRKLSPAEWRARMDRSPEMTRAEQSRRAFTSFPNTVLYSPVPYLPQALGIFLARALSTRDLVAVYLASLSSAIACALLLFFALRALDFSWRASNLCFLVAGLPMSLALAASPSADGVIITLSILTLALALRLRKQYDARSFIALLAAAALLSAGKGLYFFASLAAIPVALPALLTDWRGNWRRALLLLACSLLPMLAWNLLARGLYTTNPPVPFGHPDPRVSPGLQLQFVLHHVTQTLLMFARFLVASFRELRCQLFGVLGWLDTWLPDSLVNACLLGLLAAPLFGSPEERRFGRYDLVTTAWVLSTCIGFVAALCLFEYLSWTAFGAGFVNGLQGRHFTPMVPVFLAAIPQLFDLGRRARIAASTLILGGWGYAMLVMFSTLLVRYWKP